MLASLIVALLASSAAPTPLYAIYQAEWGFTPITTTVVFGVYAVAVLVALLTLGKLSDHVGRRPVLLAALAVQAGSLVIFATAAGVPELLVARVVQGLSTGAALGAIGAGHARHGPRARHVRQRGRRPGIGTATGALLVRAGSSAYLPAPTHLIYLALIGVLRPAGRRRRRDARDGHPRAGRAGQPEAGDHAAARAARLRSLTAAPVLFAVWALAGLYGALGPALVHALTGSGNVGARRAQPVRAGRRRPSLAAIALRRRPGPDRDAGRHPGPDRRRGA